MINEKLAESFYQDMSVYLKTIPMARLVSSYEEALRIHSEHKDPVNNRFNRFSLAYYCIGNYQTHFNFSLYINAEAQKIYAFFDEIEHDSMNLADTPAPQSHTAISIQGFREDIESYLEHAFSNAIIGYYRHSRFDTSKVIDGSDDGLYSLVSFGDVAGFEFFSSRTMFSRLRFIYYPDVSLLQDSASLKGLGHSDFINNIAVLDISQDATGKYVYITDGTYLWCVEACTFASSFSNYVNQFRASGVSRDLRFILLEG